MGTVNCHIWVTTFVKLYFFQRFCPEADSKTMLQCLKQNKNSELMDPKCKQMITKRQITQNTGSIVAWLSHPTECGFRAAELTYTSLIKLQLLCWPWVLREQSGCNKQNDLFFLQRVVGRTEWKSQEGGDRRSQDESSLKSPES